MQGVNVLYIPPPPHTGFITQIAWGMLVGTKHCQVMTAVATALPFGIATLYDILIVGFFSNILAI